MKWIFRINCILRTAPLVIWKEGPLLLSLLGSEPRFESNT